MFNHDRRLIAYITGIVALCAAIEAVVRWQAPIFAALAERGLFAEELLARHAPVGVVAIGTSRLRDAIDAQVFAQASGLTLFNASTPASNLKRITRAFERALARDGQEILLVELSRHALDEGGAESADGPSRLLAFRRAFLPENLVLMFSLLWPEAVDGAVWSRRGGLLAPLDMTPYADLAAEATAYTPRTFDGDATLNADEQRALPHYQAMVTAAARCGRTLIFLGTPIAAAARATECARSGVQGLASVLAAAAKVLDFTCAASPPAYFKDESEVHLNTRGRKVFSVALAREVARVIP